MVALTLCACRYSEAIGLLYAVNDFRVASRPSSLTGWLNMLPRSRLGNIRKLEPDHLFMAIPQGELGYRYWSDWKDFWAFLGHVLHATPLCQLKIRLLCYECPTRLLPSSDRAVNAEWLDPIFNVRWPLRLSFHWHHYTNYADTSEFEVVVPTVLLPHLPK